MAGRGSFGRAAAAEGAKLRCTRSTYWTLLSGFAVSVGFSALLASVVSSGYGDLSARARADFDPAYQGLQGLGYGLVAFGVLGVLAITSEYSGGLIRASPAAVPRRGRLLAAKAAVPAGVVFVGARRRPSRRSPSRRRSSRVRARTPASGIPACRGPCWAVGSTSP